MRVNTISQPSFRGVPEIRYNLAMAVSCALNSAIEQKNSPRLSQEDVYLGLTEGYIDAAVNDLQIIEFLDTFDPEDKIILNRGEKSEKLCSFKQFVNDSKVLGLPLEITKEMNLPTEKGFCIFKKAFLFHTEQKQIDMKKIQDFLNKILK